MRGKIKKGEFADGTWPDRMKKVVEMCREHPDVTRSVYGRVAAEGPVRRSKLKNRREQQIAMRLAVLGYFTCDSYVKDVDDRTFRLAPAKPVPNLLDL